MSARVIAQHGVFVHVGCAEVTRRCRESSDCVDSVILLNLEWCSRALRRRNIVVRILAATLLVCAVIIPSAARADEHQINSFDRHAVTLTNGAHNKIYGWIELLQGNEISGYLYLIDRPPGEPRLSSEKKYIVMDFPISMLDTLLKILREEKPQQIRYSKFGNNAAVAFLEPARAAPASAERSKEIFKQ